MLNSYRILSLYPSFSEGCVFVIVSVCFLTHSVRMILPLDKSKNDSYRSDLKTFPSQRASRSLVVNPVSMLSSIFMLSTGSQRTDDSSQGSTCAIIGTVLPSIVAGTGSSKEGPYAFSNALRLAFRGVRSCRTASCLRTASSEYSTSGICHFPPRPLSGVLR